MRNPRGPQFESWLDTKFNNLPDHSRRVMLYGYDPGDRSGKTFNSQGVYEEAEALLCSHGVPNTGDQGLFDGFGLCTIMLMRSHAGETTTNLVPVS